MERKNKYQKQALDILGTRPIAFNPDLSRALGSVNAGLFLSQLLYWWKKGRNPEMIYKTVQEVEEETSLSKTQQLNAQKTCVNRGVLEVFYKGIPPKRNYKINVEKVLDLLATFNDDKNDEKTSLKRHVSRQLNVQDSNEKKDDIASYITESTQKNTKKQIWSGVRLEKNLKLDTEEQGFFHKNIHNKSNEVQSIGDILGERMARVHQRKKS